ncbi:MAG: hypothetical protein KKA81_03215 [Bacteroidetes bacterium]|nr:hypothetical protein [Bacteroidota bacterium]
MKFFHIKAVFQEFFPYLKSNMQPMDRHKLCIMHRETEEVQDIYIATESQELIDIIGSRYTMQACDQPREEYGKDQGNWMFRGNQSLMGLF